MRKLVQVLTLVLLCVGSYFFVASFVQNAGPVIKNNTNLQFTPPPDGVNTEGKNRLRNILTKIDYLQPEYVPPAFIKSYDLAGDSQITTFYEAVDTDLNYSGLTLHQYVINEAPHKNDSELFAFIKDGEKSDRRYYAKSANFDNKVAVYVQKPAHLVDPYFHMGFAGSEEERLLKRGSEKVLFVFLPKTLIELSIGYTNGISSRKAQQELTKMAESLTVGTIPANLEINLEDQSELHTSVLVRTANNIESAIATYYGAKKEFPWQTSTGCNNGSPPWEVQLSSGMFNGCMALIKQYLYLSNDKNYYDENVFSYLFVSYGDAEQFIQPRWDTDALEVYKTQLPAICFKPTELSDYVKSYLNQDYKTYTEDYPMYTKVGKVNEDCKNSPESKECYSCAKNLDYLIR